MTTAPLTDARALEMAERMVNEMDADWHDAAHMIAATLLRVAAEAYEAGKKEGRG